MNEKICATCKHRNKKGNQEPCVQCKDPTGNYCSHIFWEERTGSLTDKEANAVANDIEKLLGRINEIYTDLNKILRKVKQI